MENIIEFQKARIEALEKELERYKMLAHDTHELIKKYQVELEEIK